MKKLFYLGLGALVFSACAKESANSQSFNPDANSFSELRISPNFDWETSHAIQLTVEGLAGGASTMHFLTVSDPNGNELYKALTTTGTDHNLFFDLADQHNYVTVKCGSISKEVQVKNRKAIFNYVIADDRSDLDPTDR